MHVVIWDYEVDQDRQVLFSATTRHGYEHFNGCQIHKQRYGDQRRISFTDWNKGKYTRYSIQGPLQVERG